MTPRQVAKSEGRTQYYTGKSCSHGHVASRFVASGRCVECARLDVSGSRTRWTKDHPTANRGAVARYKVNHPDRIKRPTPEKAVEYSRAYAKRHPGRVNAHTAKRRAALLQATPAWLTSEQHLEIRAIYEESSRRTQPSNVDHTVPLQSPLVCGLHVPWNLTIMEAGPNQSKGAKLLPDLVEIVA